ncbi:hypothetical protein BZL30_6359 [Mycobacterium kansasii]|uniref:Uncharacterized protein n=1 Tax=Mycobacterium kansasii TaxID=1768 RepID=A0A1V3X6D7_MYCKA|nr:hypothetical protein BZL30_6359 [Mycobacterium kansasii]OOK74688.1 hypothetical protein BZL29_4383 [Mycobacterium kansasii]
MHDGHLHRQHDDHFDECEPAGGHAMHEGTTTRTARAADMWRFRTATTSTMCTTGAAMPPMTVTMTNTDEH